MDNINNERIKYAHSSVHNPYKANVDNIICKIYDKTAYPINSLKDVTYNIYVELFSLVPHKIDLNYDGDYLNTAPDDYYGKHNRFNKDKNIAYDFLKEIPEIENNFSNSGQWRTFKNKEIKEQSTIANLIGHYEYGDIAAYRIDEQSLIIFGTYKTIMYYKDQTWYAFTPEPTLPQYIIDNIVTEDVEEDERYFDYVVYNSHGFSTTELPIKKIDTNIEMNYNDDLPDEEIMDFINNADSGICILYGAPGTGKTSYIRNLMHKCTDVDFMILNTSCFDAINDSSFVELIVDNRDSVVILEDCEDLLTERMNGNSRIATLLNLSDGILGDALRLKFICTFNAKIGKIDSAVLRKGRTHVKYEFKPLTHDKAKVLADSLNITLPAKKSNEGYTLSEIYYNDNNLVEGNVSTKVGF